ncbi:MAG: hypothetical protein AAFW46_14590 [Pseudomonadota bacterium]
MKIIAHRPFRDERSLASFDPACLDGFDGIELDLRTLEDGSVAVFHAPILTADRRPRLGRVKSLQNVLERLAPAVEPTRFVLLDVKTSGAAAAIADALPLIGSEREVAFICWHLDDVAAARCAAPNALILLGVAPLRRARKDGPAPVDYYLFNRFPYLASGDRFRQRVGQFNQHNINLRWLDPANVAAGLPTGVDGICFHKRLFNRAIVRGARKAGVATAVYGFPSMRDPAIARLAGEIDYAIVDPDLGAPRPTRLAALRRARLLSKRWRRRRAAGSA